MSRNVQLRGKFSAKTEAARIFYDGNAIALTRRPSQILLQLARSDFVTRDQLLVVCGSINSLRVHLSAIRKALPEGVSIDNDFGKGYRLVLPG